MTTTHGRILNCGKSVLNPDKDFTLQTLLGTVDVVSAITSIKVRDKVDLRQSWWTIGNQKSSGACVGWAIADSLVRWHMVKAGKLDKDQRLSMRFVWMASKETDTFKKRPTTFIEGEGTTLKAGLEIVRAYGILPDSDLPFETNALYAGDAESLYKIAGKRKIKAYYNLGFLPGAWRYWLSTRGPVAARFRLDDSWHNAKKAKTARLDHYDRASASGGHAVALVGYDDKHFIVRNTWGSRWGDDGYAYVSEKYILAALTEAYGVVVTGDTSKKVFNPW